MFSKEEMEEFNSEMDKIFGELGHQLLIGCSPTYKKLYEETNAAKEKAKEQDYDLDTKCYYCGGKEGLCMNDVGNTWCEKCYGNCLKEILPGVDKLRTISGYKETQ